MKSFSALLVAGLVLASPATLAAGSANPASPGESPWVALARGRVEPPGGIVPLGATRNGILRDVLVAEGAHVAKGEALAVLDETPAQLGLAVVQEEFAQTHAALALLQIRHAAAAREFDRVGKLVAEQLANAQELDQARDRLAEAQAEICQVSAAEAVAHARVAAAQYEVDACVVRTPASGLIVRRFAKPGEVVVAQTTAPLFWLALDGPRVVIADFDEDAVSHLSRGQLAEIVTESTPSRIVKASVQKIGLIFGPKRPATDDPAERQDVRVVECELRLEDTSPPLLFGQRVLVRVFRHSPLAK